MKLNRNKVKVYTRQRGAFITVKLALFLSSLAMVTVLAWLRIDWGITHWAYHAHFSNFWPGVYFALAGELQERRGEVRSEGAGKSWHLIRDSSTIYLDTSATDFNCWYLARILHVSDG